MRLGKVVLVFLFMLYSFRADAQNGAVCMPDHDFKPYYFGITFAINYSVYQIGYSSSFANTDTFKRIQPKWSPGFNLGLIGNLRLNKYFDLRFVPSLEFAEKLLQFEYGIPRDSVSNRNIESINMHLPLQIKFKSDRINDFRFYVIGGGKFDYDMAANARSHRKDEFLKVSPLDFGVEVGVGFEFFYPDFIFSPEIKISQGLSNQLFIDRSLPLTNAIQYLHTRTIVISIHLEG